MIDWLGLKPLVDFDLRLGEGTGAALGISIAEAACKILAEMATFAHSLGLEVHAGHGLTFDTVGPIAAFPELHELNIGHFLISEAIFLGLGPAIQEMRARMDEARSPMDAG
jgi:pyridoxine 5-phosphate synthase